MQWQLHITIMGCMSSEWKGATERERSASLIIPSKSDYPFGEICWNLLEFEIFWSIEIQIFISQSRLLTWGPRRLKGDFLLRNHLLVFHKMKIRASRGNSLYLVRGPSVKSPGVDLDLRVPCCLGPSRLARLASITPYASQFHFHCPVYFNTIYLNFSYANKWPSNKICLKFIWFCWMFQV